MRERIVDAAHLALGVVLVVCVFAKMVWRGGR